MRFIISILLSLLTFSSWASIHGKDDRRLLKDVDHTKWQEIGKAVAAMFQISELKSIPYRNLQNKKQLCSSESYAEEISASSCSGVLIGEDLLLTAGHCIRTQADCENHFWSFDFYESPQNKTDLIFPQDKIYSCKKLEAQEKNYLTQADYAIIRLDRKVTQATPITVSWKEAAPGSHELTIIGHPSGLPKIMASHGEILENNPKDLFFRTNLDAFGGNSGAPVFNSETYELEGILIRGWTDFSTNWDSEDLCRNWYTCERDGDCDSEDVVKINTLPLKKFLTPYMR